LAKELSTTNRAVKNQIADSIPTGVSTQRF